MPSIGRYSIQPYTMHLYWGGRGLTGGVQWECGWSKVGLKGVPLKEVEDVFNVGNVIWKHPVGNIVGLSVHYLVNSSYCQVFHTTLHNASVLANKGGWSKGVHNATVLDDKVNVSYYSTNHVIRYATMDGRLMT